MENTRLPKVRNVRRPGGGRGLRRRPGKIKYGCLLDDLRAFGVNADLWTTASQDEGGGRKTTEHGAENFVAKKRIAATKVRARIRHALVCCP